MTSKDQALAHFPSGHYFANAAWTVIAALAHNLARWTQTIALPNTTVRTARTLRRTTASPSPPRLIRTARRWDAAGCPPAGPGPRTSSPRLTAIRGAPTTAPDLAAGHARTIDARTAGLGLPARPREPPSDGPQLTRTHTQSLTRSSTDSHRPQPGRPDQPPATTPSTSNGESGLRPR